MHGNRKVGGRKRMDNAGYALSIFCLQNVYTSIYLACDID